MFVPWLQKRIIFCVHITGMLISHGEKALKHERRHHLFAQEGNHRADKYKRYFKH